MDDGRRKTFEELYSSLTPDERRGRIFLKPEFRDAYNELVEADRQFPVPTYLWEKWVPVIGVFPVAVYLELRRMCFVNRATGERRDWCWPKQETLAKRLGVRKRQTVGEALRVLEDHAFIRRERSYLKRGGAALMQRGSDRYLVFFEVPLVAADAVELLLRESSPRELDGGSSFGPSLPAIAIAVGDGGKPAPDTSEIRTNHQATDMSAKRTYGPADPGGSEKRTYPAVRKTDSRTITRTITTNVTNVVAKRYGETQGLRHHPEVAAMGADERAKRDALAWEIGDALGTMNGKWDGESHKSAGFHRRVAYLMPEMLVREALTSTRDALEQRRAGRGGLRSDPAAFFAGAAKELAKQNGIDLGLRPSKSPAPALSQVVPGTVLEGLPVEEEHVSPERVREYIGQILAKLPKSSNEA